MQARLTELTRRFLDGLSEIAGVTVYGPADPADSVGIVSLNVDGIPCATVSRLIDDEWGVMTRAGLHCSPAAHRSLGTAPEGTLRFSWGFDTSDEDIDIAVEALRTRRRPGPEPRAREELGLKWGGVVSFFASEHAMRSERVLERAGLPARLVPGRARSARTAASRLRSGGRTSRRWSRCSRTPRSATRRSTLSI